MSVHWRAQSHVKWPRGCREFQHSSLSHQELDPCHPTLTHRFVSITWRKRDMTIFATCNQFFWVQDFRSRIVQVQVEYQGQTRNTRILDANLWSMHIIAFDKDKNWNIFTSHNFCEMLVKQLIDLEKVKTDNLIFRTNLRDRVIDGWSVTL